MGLFKRRARPAPDSSGADASDRPLPEIQPETQAPPPAGPDEERGYSAGSSGSEAPETPAPETPVPETPVPETSMSAALAGANLEETLLAQVASLASAPAASLRTSAAAPAERADDYPESDPEIPEEEEEEEAAADSIAEETPADADEADADAAEFERLRRLVLGREIDGLSSLRRQLTDPEVRARALSRVITEALLLRTQADRKLDAVLKDTVDRILRGSVRHNPAELADYLFPVMGPAIRRSITESLRSMLNDFSKLLEKSFTLTGLKWRLTAMRTGRSFSEVALLNNLEYQVEEVFLVHAKTGLPLLHMVNDGVNAKDDSGDQVAAMFTAIQQFVSDSFAEGELNDLTFGDLRVCVVQAPEVYLACLVRGQAPPSLRQEMQTILELLVVELTEDLDGFDGDTAPFQKSRRLLDSLLISRLKEENKKLSPTAFLLPVLVAAIIFGPFIYIGYSNRQARLKAEAAAELQERIYHEVSGPGLWPVHVIHEGDGQWSMTLLKDDLVSLDPNVLLANLGLGPDRIRINFLPFISRAPEIVGRRAALLLAGQPETLIRKFDWPAETMILTGQASFNSILSVYDSLRSVPGLRSVLIENLFDAEKGLTVNLGRDHVLRLEGRADLGWREALKERIGSMHYVSGLDLSLLKDDDDSRRVKELMAGLNGVIIRFPLNKDQPIEEDRPLLIKAANDLNELEDLAAPMGLTVSLTIYGYTDLSGQATRNYDLSQARARALAALLYERGSSIALTTFGLGPDPAAEDLSGRTPNEKKEAAQASRRIELKAKLDRARLPLNLDS